jgi:flagellar protein FlgJ
MAISNQADFYLNMRQFGELKLGARNNSAQATEAVAQQFEALFVQQMLGAMRSAALVDESQHSSYMDFYQDMYDKQIATTISKQGGLGIAKMLIRQLPGGQDDAGNSGKELPLHAWQEVESELPVKAMDYQSKNQAVLVNKFDSNDIAEQKVGDLNPVAETGPKTGHQFVSEIWPHAAQAAQSLGLDAKVLVAQSVLETGWGKHTMRFPDGRSTYNLFGIKAGPGWDGSTMSKPTLEFRDGVMKTELAQFRAYDSMPHALSDYVRLIQSSPRYDGALKHDGDAEHYLHGLQRAGYATDPDYADKILNIMRGRTFGQTLASLEMIQDQSPIEETNHA